MPVAQSPSLAALPFSLEELANVNPRQYQYLVALPHTESINREEYERMFSVSRNTATIDLHDLKIRKLIVLRGAANLARYSLIRREDM